MPLKIGHIPPRYMQAFKAWSQREFYQAGSLAHRIEKRLFMYDHSPTTRGDVAHFLAGGIPTGTLAIEDAKYQIITKMGAFVKNYAFEAIHYASSGAIEATHKIAEFASHLIM